MKFQPPPSPSGWPADSVAPSGRAGGRETLKTLVGGLPWAEDTAGSASAVAGMPIVIDDLRDRGRGGDFDDDPFSRRSLWASLDAWVRRSPPITVSVSLHVLLLLLGALWIVRGKAPDTEAIQLSFASTTIEEEKGVQIKPVPEPVEEPQPEEAKTDKPPVEDPVAAPAVASEAVEGPGAPGEVTHTQVIGSLLAGRQEGRREALVNEFGGSEATEAAVARALVWLVKQQGRNGLWSLKGPYADGGSQENNLAATAMALLALQGAGNVPQQGKHRAAVNRGWRALLARQESDGRFDFTPMPNHHALYSHAQATIALCELYGMTKDETYELPARRAIAYAVATQGKNGGWRYEPGAEGDMSVTGWFLMALKSGQMAGLEVPEETFAGIVRFLDAVASDGGSRYSYRVEVPGLQPKQITPAVSAEGLLCRQYLGWPRNDKRLVAGLEQVFAARPFDLSKEKDVYAWYYVTQVAHHMGGEPWERWNTRMRELLPAAQVQQGREAGSWNPDLDLWGSAGGRLYMTCFCTYMLEVYYRHLPLYAELPAAAP